MGSSLLRGCRRSVNKATLKSVSSPLSALNCPPEHRVCFANSIAILYLLADGSTACAKNGPGGCRFKSGANIDGDIVGVDGFAEIANNAFGGFANAFTKHASTNSTGQGLLRKRTPIRFA